MPDNAIRRVIQFARQGYTSIKFPIYDTDWDSEAYRTVSGQNSNNSVRVTDDFLRAVETDADWNLTFRKNGAMAKTMKARGSVGADRLTPPGLAPIPASSSTPPSTIGTPARRPATIKASNPCSEYMFLDDTACNLASLNLMAFRNTDGSFDVAAYEHAIRLWTVVLEIAVTMAQFPSRRIAQLSYEYRTLGLGYANIGGLLMASGIPYNSACGPGALRRAHRDHDRRLLCNERRDGARARRLPRLCGEPRSHAPGHAQPRPRRPRRARRL